MCHHATSEQQHCHLTQTLRTHSRVEINCGTINLTVMDCIKEKDAEDIASPTPSRPQSATDRQVPLSFDLHAANAFQDPSTEGSTGQLPPLARNLFDGPRLQTSDFSLPYNIFRAHVPNCPKHICPPHRF